MFMVVVYGGCRWLDVYGGRCSASLPRFERLCSSDEDGDYLNVLELVTGLVLMNSPEPFSEKIRA